MNDEDLAEYQAALLEALARSPSPKDAKAALSENNAHASYVESFDLRMIGLGMHLVAKWGHRKC